MLWLVSLGGAIFALVFSVLLKNTPSDSIVAHADRVFKKGEGPHPFPFAYADFVTSSTSSSSSSGGGDDGGGGDTGDTGDSDGGGGCCGDDGSGSCCP
jgi:hypothetical protein